MCFTRQADLQAIYGHLIRTAIHTVKPDDIATFLGKKLNGNYQDEMGNRYNVRIEGTRVRHSMGMASIKMYDKFGQILRIETTAKDVSFFKHYREVEQRNGEAVMKFAPMKKTIYSLGALREVLERRAVAAHIDLARGENRAAGVTFVDATTRQTREIRGKSVVLCAQALESTRILLNSQTREGSAGVGNSSGLLGRGLMDHVVGAGATGELRGYDERPTVGGPQRANGIYLIRFRNVRNGPKHPRFIRGYGYQGEAGPQFDFQAGGFGAAYKKAVIAGTYGISLGAFGESLARNDNYIAIDPELKDTWGIPALHIHMTHGDNEKALMEDAAASAAQVLEECGAKNIKVNSSAAEPGMAIHELGTARMGDDAKTSVTDQWCQLHDVPNIFVMDGACFTSSACQNPTLSMMAIAVRACDHLIDRFKRNDM